MQELAVYTFLFSHCVSLFLCHNKAAEVSCYRQLSVETSDFIAGSKVFMAQMNWLCEVMIICKLNRKG